MSVNYPVSSRSPHLAGEVRLHLAAGLHDDRGQFAQPTEQHHDSLPRHRADPACVERVGLDESLHHLDEVLQGLALKDMG